MPGCEELVSEHSHLPCPQLQASWLRSSRLGWALHGLTSKCTTWGCPYPGCSCLGFEAGLRLAVTSLSLSTAICPRLSCKSAG